MAQGAGAAGPEPETSERFDVAIIGAGISGIGAAYHLMTQCPGTRFVILEAKETFGGTWVTHRYPGIRSDSDLFTFGYRFKPWKGNPIATAEEILAYLREVIDENGIDAHIRYGHAISAARWSSDDNTWTLEGSRSDTGEPVRLAARFLWMCQGYYRHEGGYTPQWEGMDTFGGRIVHPQSWPEDLDVADKTVVVIGSGATAATLIPAIAERCRSVTMLQRSPTFYIPARNANDLADTLRDAGSGRNVDPRDHAAESPLRSGGVHPPLLRGAGNRQDRTARGGARLSRRRLRRRDPLHPKIPALAPAHRLHPGRRPLPRDPVRESVRGHRRDRPIHAVRHPHKSGQRIEADIVVTATGFHLNVLGDIDFLIDGKPLDVSETVTYGGMMLTGVPNLAWVFGYFRSSWTLRVDLVADFVCRLLNHMKARGAQAVVPRLRAEERDMPLSPWVDPEDFNPGYLMRDLDLLPKRGDKAEWRHSHDYWVDKDLSQDRPRRRDARLRLTARLQPVKGSCGRRRSRARSWSPCSRRDKPSRSSRR